MNTCSLFMSNASRHQLDRPLYLPVGTRERGKHDRITYYVFIFFSSRARPVIKGAPPRTRMIYRRRCAGLIRWDRLITRTLFGISRAGSSTSRIFCPYNIVQLLRATAPDRVYMYVSHKTFLRASHRNFTSNDIAGTYQVKRRHYTTVSGINKIISHV